MPIYMDRHDIEGATAEAVAEAHREDLRVQHKHGCKTLTYWFDESRGTAFCLIEGPTADAVQSMHREAHGLVPNEVMEVDVATVAQFLGRVTDPLGSGPVQEPAFRAIMFTDMADSTRLTNALGDDAAFELLQRHHEIVLAKVAEHDGSEVDRAGDGFLLSFSSVAKSVACAIDIQRELKSQNIEEPQTPIRVRIGIGAGEPVTDGKALFGSIINLTARICAHAQASQILAASVVRDLCTGKGFSFHGRGAITFKGFDEPIDLHEVAWQAQ